MILAFSSVEHNGKTVAKVAGLIKNKPTISELCNYALAGHEHTRTCTCTRARTHTETHTRPSQLGCTIQSVLLVSDTVSAVCLGRRL